MLAGVMEAEPRRIWFGYGGCVEQHDDGTFAVFVRGELLARHHPAVGDPLPPATAVAEVAHAGRQVRESAAHGVIRSGGCAFGAERAAGFADMDVGGSAPDTPVTA